MGGCVSNAGDIKLLKADGKMIRLEPPLYAKDIIWDDEYRNYGIFDAGSVRRLGLLLARPLPPHAKLRPSRLYYLVPLPLSFTNMPPSQKLKSYSLRQRGGSGKGEMSISVKSRTKAEDSASFITQPQTEGNMNAGLLENVATPLLIQSNTSTRGRQISSASGWKPSLYTIAELYSDG
ncbi:hypothetical protein SUGI_0836350 [Cryptomeria japonica]|uniref:uncharacterized protein LOC131066858 n=1 Tax=Cryptomeria japonica TaxID=3369 RepID=UPI0024149A04|nr:uncharacterized protein LOC131066858 [Cryptomeria japonica]GLJ40540.1 hypothetical protein SUGI_0836350 [Cryptomeria japonica]